MSPAEPAAQIARRVLSGGYDPLLACRDLADLRAQLPEVGADILNTFTAVSSKVDGFPIGLERSYWAKDSLVLKDIEISRYREQMRGVIESALHELLKALGKTV